MFDAEKYKEILERKICTLNGIGVKRAAAFSALSVYTVGDLLYHFPRAYQNRGNIRHITEAIIGENCSFLLTIGTRPKSAMLKNNKIITKFTAFDDSGTVVITYFNSKFVEKIFHEGETFRFWGKVIKDRGRFVMASPIYERYLEGIRLPDTVPVYPSTSRLSQKIISDAVSEALSLFSETEFPELMPKDFIKRLRLPSAIEALKSIHFGNEFSEVENARRYFSAEELYVFSLGIAITKSKKKNGLPPIMHAIDTEMIIKSFGFPMTNAQKRSVKEIEQDMINAEMPMTRLLSGDVGSGKTAVCAVALYISLSNGFQAALMAPTEILAVQHYEYLSKIFEGLGFRTVLLVGSKKASEKKEIKRQIEQGEVHLVIGTHALITPDIKFFRLGLVVTDEQHRFGVEQRARLGGEETEVVPHVLVMSATPIPRTLALILYGDLSLSMLDEQPIGRQRVDTFVIDEGYRTRLNDFIRKQIQENGGQVYIVCPTVEEQDKEECGDLLTFGPDGDVEVNFERPKLKSAVEFYKEIKEDIFSDLSVGLVHGKMNGDEKAKVMKSFSDGETNILVTTTVIEVGVNVPNASLMIVENADRFGLAQLHQLRGRVGRGNKKSYCILVSSNKSEKARKRLSIMKSTYDGYKIAELDLQMRGPGDYFPSNKGSIRQHGAFNCISSADMILLKEALCEAEKVISKDPLLINPENRFAAYKLKCVYSANERSMQ